MKFSLRFFLFLFYSCSCLAQTYNNQIEFSSDNDEFLLSDRYYTSGTFIGYKRSLKKPLFFKKKKGKSQLEFLIGSQIFTPQDKDDDNPDLFHRPYAGWLFGKLRAGSVKEKSALFFGVEIGVTGEESLAQSLQDWAHNTVGIRKATWVEQIPYKVLVNFEVQFLSTLVSGENNSLMLSSSPVFGTKDLSFNNSLYYFFGTFNKLQNTSRFTLLNNSIVKEFFGFISFGHSLVFHNTLIEGSLFNDESTFTTEAEKNIFLWKIGLVSKGKKGIFKLSYNFNSRETSTSKIHGFGSISYAINF